MAVPPQLLKNLASSTHKDVSDAERNSAAHTLAIDQSRDGRLTRAKELAEIGAGLRPEGGTGGEVGRSFEDGGAEGEENQSGFSSAGDGKGGGVKEEDKGVVSKGGEVEGGKGDEARGGHVKGDDVKADEDQATGA